MSIDYRGAAELHFGEALGECILKGADASVAAKELQSAFTEFFRDSSPSALAMDGRAQQWRVRIRLYNMANQNEPEADTDADHAADYPGEMVIAGLPGVAAELAVLTQAFHGVACQGMDVETLKHRLKSLRPTLSRRRVAGHNDAVWRVPYKVLTADAFGGDNRELDWLARVDVIRETT